MHAFAEMRSRLTLGEDVESAKIKVWMLCVWYVNLYSVSCLKNVDFYFILFFILLLETARQLSIFLSKAVI